MHIDFSYDISCWDDQNNGRRLRSLEDYLKEEVINYNNIKEGFCCNLDNKIYEFKKSILSFTGRQLYFNVEEIKMNTVQEKIQDIDLELKCPKCGNEMKEYATNLGKIKSCNFGYYDGRFGFSISLESKEGSCNDFLVANETNLFNIKKLMDESNVKNFNDLKNVPIEITWECNT